MDIIGILKEISFIIFLISYIFSQYALLKWIKNMNNYQAVQDKALLFLLSENKRRRSGW